LKKPKILWFVAQSVSAGLAIAFLIVLFQPSVLAGLRARLPGFIDFAHRADGNAPQSYARAVEMAAPSVINIYTTRYVEQNVNPLLNDPVLRRFFNGRLKSPSIRAENSLGSGVILDDRGYILTNNHVVAGADAIEVALPDGRSAKASVVGTDPETDLAVIHISIDRPPAIASGNSDELRVGDVVLAIGNPFGIGQTVTQGIISATGRNRVGLNVFENFIQTDAAINPGNSGGALIDASGRLVGINTAIVSETGGSQGIGFAIPVNMARAVMDQIIESGSVVRGWLGIETYDLSPTLARALGVRSQGGALVKAVLIDGPADQAGIEPDDVITAIDDKPVTSARQGLNLITRLRPGTSVEIDLIRGGKAQRVSATVSERPHNNFLHKG
jgi:Do/DeqQ family serine protease